LNHYTTIYGYIVLWPGYDERHRQTLAAFPFDNRRDFPNIFHFLAGPHHPTISFAMYARDFENELTRWLERFETLLGSLLATYARVHLVPESNACPAAPRSIQYIVAGETNADGRTKWTRITTPDRPEMKRETLSTEETIFL
jgi:hypothetical protein